MLVPPTLQLILLRLHGVPLIRISWDICLAAVIKSISSFVIAILFVGKWERFVFQGLLFAALFCFLVKELDFILKKEVGFDFKRARKEFVEARRTKALENRQHVTIERSSNEANKDPSKQKLTSREK